MSLFFQEATYVADTGAMMLTIRRFTAVSALVFSKSGSRFARCGATADKKNNIQLSAHGVSGAS